MLHEFITENRTEIVTRTRAKVAARSAPRATAEELERGVPLFLTQLVRRLREEAAPPSHRATDLRESATIHGRDLHLRGFTVDQVVHDYGDICQAVTALAVERNALITNEEFKMLNGCLDEAIAGAVTEFERSRERSMNAESTEHLGEFAHELRNLLGVALLSFEGIKRGVVGAAGSTGAIHGRTLLRLRELVDRSLAEVRLDAGLRLLEDVPMWEIVEDVGVAATILAQAAGIAFTTVPVPRDVHVRADRPLLGSAIANLLQNAIKFTHSNGHVTLRTRADAERVFVDVEDECGGLPPGKAEELFRPFEQRARDRSGLGLGLSIARKAAAANGGEIRVANVSGSGCIFTIELPRVAVALPTEAADGAPKAAAG